MSAELTNPAQGSLLDPANVGKNVWFSHNGNKAWPARIVKVTRTNVHLEGQGSRRPYSLRVGDMHDDQRHALGSHSGFSISACTESYRLDREVRRDMEVKVQEFARSLSRYSTEHLARIVATIEGE